MKTFCSLISLLILSINLFAQLPSQFEEKHFPKLRRNIVYKTIITKDSAYLAVGEKESNIGYDQDLAIIKINRNGEKEWQIIYDDKLDWAYGYDVEEYENGDLIVIGEIQNVFNKHRKNDLIVFKVTSEGKIIWQKKYPLPLNSTLRRIQISTSESIVLIGEEKLNNNFYFLILNSEGSVTNEFKINKNKLLHFDEKRKKN